MEKGERKRQLEIAKKMKADGLSAEVIAKYTGLSIDETQTL